MVDDVTEFYPTKVVLFLRFQLVHYDHVEEVFVLTLMTGLTLCL